MNRFNFEQSTASGTRKIHIVIPGSPEKSSEENMEAYGMEVIQRFSKLHDQASKDGKTILFDLATGSSPAAVYKALNTSLKQGTVSLSNVVFTGHDEAWGSYQSGSKSDFDNFRRELLEKNGIEVTPITSIEQVTAKKLEGNFLPMHQNQDPKQAMVQFGGLYSTLQKRDDILSVGLYGVGTDAHVGEMQTQDQGLQISMKQRNVYVASLTHYSVEDGSFYWRNDEGGFHPEDNIFWTREEKEGEDSGRAALEGYTGIDYIMGLGWRQLLGLDVMLLTFNNESKSLALNLAIEGSIDGVITTEDGSVVERIQWNKGEGEGILADLRAYVEELGADVPDMQNAHLKADLLFRAAYGKLHEEKASADDPRYRQLWEFANRYLGKRAPLSRLLRLRTLLGKETVIIATPETFKHSNHEALLNFL